MDKKEIDALIVECCDDAEELISKLRRLNDRDSDAAACIAEAVLEDDDIWIRDIRANAKEETK